MGRLLTPVVGVLGAALLLGEAFGWREAAALALTVSGVLLAIRGWSNIRPDGDIWSDALLWKTQIPA